MKEKIKTHILGKLKIYLTVGEAVKSRSLVRKLFPKSVARQIVLEAKKDGLSHASTFQTNFGFVNGGELQQQQTETGNPKLTVCVEFIDTKEKLESFVKRHKAMLQGKVIIYKEVEFWDIEV